jgi:ketopantoate hydroxymethyltransferase
MKAVTISDLHKKKQRVEKITILTVYDRPFVRLI